MKRALPMILATMMAAALCAGCGNPSQGTTQTQATAAAAENAAEKTDNTESAPAEADAAKPEGNLKAAFITPQAHGDTGG